MTVDEIKAKYQGDDAFSKGANAAYHQAAKYKGRVSPATIKEVASYAGAESYAKANDFKSAGIAYRPKSGWAVLCKRSGYLNPTEAQAYAQDLLKAVAAIKKAPAIKK